MKFTAALQILFLPITLIADRPKSEPTKAAKKEAALVEVEGKYQAWVASLAAPHQFWEKVLPVNLGSLYLAFSGKANVHRAPANGGPTAQGIEKTLGALK